LTLRHERLPLDGMFQREIGAGRCEATGAARANLAGRERTTAPGVQRAPSPVVTVSCGT
jgi:hypothetical protein